MVGLVLNQTIFSVVYVCLGAEGWRGFRLVWGRENGGKGVDNLELGRFLCEFVELVLWRYGSEIMW